MVHRVLVVAALVAMPTMPALAQGVLTTVRGTVQDSTGAPMSDAEVLIGQRSGRTSAVGAFVVDSVAPGRYTLTVRKIGYDPVRVRVDVPRAGLSGLSYRLTLAASILPTVVVSGERLGIYGTVALVGERPAIGAIVQVLGPDGGDVRTDSAGQFAFGSLGQGSYLVRVTHPGWSERRISVTLGRDTGQELAVNLLPSKAVASRADVGALEDLGKRLSFGLRMERLMRDDLALRGPINVCDLPQLRSVIGGPHSTITLILNGTTIYRNMPVHSLCSWRANEVELVEFAPNVCSEVTHSVAAMLFIFCPGYGRRIRTEPRSLSGQTGRMSGTDSGAFVIIWERR